MNQDNGQKSGGDEVAAAAAVAPACHASAGVEPGAGGEAPVTRFSFPWLDGQGRIKMIQAFLCP